MNKRKENNKFKIKIAIFILLVVITLTGVTYGVFFTTRTQTTSNTIASGCFNLSFAESTNSEIALANALPTSDTSGLASTPYEFNLKNNCNVKAKYVVILNIKDASFSSNYVRVSINGGAAQDLSSLTINNGYRGTGYTANNAYELATGTLTNGNSINFSLRAWLKDSVLYENVKGSSWSGQVKVVSVATS